MGDGRGSHGHFLPGNSGGPGRPRRTAAVESVYLRAFADGCPPETMREIAVKLAAKAVRGDVRAADLLLRYLTGGPRTEALLEIALMEASGFDPSEPWEATERRLVSVVAEAAKTDPEARAWLDGRDPDGTIRERLGVASR